MKRSICIQFAIAAAIIAALAVINFIYWGWLGMVMYLLFAALCMVPSILLARKVIRSHNVLDNRIRAIEHGLDEIDSKVRYVRKKENRMRNSEGA